jgi:hypothetical protein
MRHGSRGGKQRRQELARLAIAIAIKEENVQRESNSGNTNLPVLPSPTGNSKNTNNKGGRLSLEVRDLL